MSTIGDILDAVVSHAQASGYFDRVNQHEPKAAPNGITCALWVDSVDPIKSSPLNKTSIRVGLLCRIYSNMLQEPQDMIDVNVTDAAFALMAAYSGDFQLDSLSNVRCVDLLGAYGIPLSIKAGYVPQDNKLYRVMTITLPIIVDDVWSQVP